MVLSPRRLSNLRSCQINADVVSTLGSKTDGDLFFLGERKGGFLYLILFKSSLVFARDVILVRTFLGLTGLLKLSPT